MIAREDLALFQVVDSPEDALAMLQRELPIEPEGRTPAFARSRCPGE